MGRGKSIRNRRLEKRKGRGEDFVQRWNRPTQAKIGLERATHAAVGVVRLIADMQNLDSQRATERPCRIIRFRTVVIHENRVESAITKEGAAEFSYIRRCLHPARRFRIELS